MAEEILVKDPLTPEMIEAGAALVQYLDAQHWPVSAAFWFFEALENQWVLFLASPMVASEGPKSAYNAVGNALTQLHQEQTNLRRIKVVPPDQPLVALLHAAVNTGAGISSIRFSRNSINGHFIEDAHIYRMT